jgi:acetoin utilization deacetylase AcuC-like enzyme
MKVIFHKDFYQVYTSDPAAEAGRIECVIKAIESEVEFVTAEHATEDEILAVHSRHHVETAQREGLYDIASLAAGGAIQAAVIGMQEPAFGLIRPPGHHASSSSAWGFCVFNNMAIALTWLKNSGRINSAFVLDIDLHYGDGTVNILGNEDWVTIFNPLAKNREDYLDEVRNRLKNLSVDLIGVSAGFDYHIDDWGGMMTTEDYQHIGKFVRNAAINCNAGYFGVLEGGYNHHVLGQNVAALLGGMQI